MKSTALLPLTKLVLIVTAVVQLVMAVAAFFLPGLTLALLSPAKDAPLIAVQYVGAFYLAGAIASAYAFRQDNWIAARTYLLNAVIFVGLAIVVTLINLPGGVQPISYAYLLLSVIYVPLVIWVWRQESARNVGV
ncbi:MAG TPA: hypothetical protein VFD70_22035 [Anaerolineae bacterium]|nr:hypothetical protein [Anaerolineae bacterium]